MEQEILIALGSNLGSGAGDPAETVRAAFRSLTARNLILRRSSRLYATPCFPAGTGPDYVNACAVIAGAGDAPGILTLLHEVEAEFGRLRRERWGSRTLDIDLLAIGGTVLPDVATQAEWRALPPGQQIGRTPDRLILPHPRLQDRAFVLVPLCDVAADWVHPLLGRSAAELCAALPAEARVEVVPL